ncbi:DNA-binding SARP family transcriptional activator [Streptomyces sp. 1114.5]|uniref:AfsR/SARP family transcriptional regulator n=1 Tax=Streptomyces sp. 1114.5 TaxID=1938830 RepID=UPI000F20DE0E|nr:BTAD domain-containing putative transcriptional regulator [Streptomyces sp. 1114.5]RKT08917.1 DNA-binding SARP family transcriptional activator [Streptomyces sp. 1114.5]
MVRIRLLGPVELRVEERGFATLAGAQRRAILALLALRLGRVVTVDQFCEALWGEWPPASARAAVQGHVAALRKLLAGTPFELHTRASGYLLAGPAEEVDALRFEALAARAAEHADRGDDTVAVALLEEALRLWRGEALADLPDTPSRAAAVDQLGQARTAALLCWAGLRLRQGTGAAAVAGLEQNVRADGLREELVALLVRCLHQAGRPADALAAYHRARQRLDRELGIRPGPVLQAALAEVLADDHPEQPPATPPTPAPSPLPPAPRASHASPASRRLPRRPVDFVGRASELHRLDHDCGPDRGGDGPVLVVGPAGVGKTALVTAWAHRAAARFPDGVLFADLHDLAPAAPTGSTQPTDPAAPVTPTAPAQPEAVLAEFLRALGVPADELPADRTARAALFRERTYGRRLLVVLDDAADADQVADLLPDGPGCAAVVTGRGSLEDLVALDGATLLRLAPLPAEEALLLLERALTPERVRAEPDAAARLARFCDHLPLALRIAAARLAAQPEWTIAELADELADEQTRLAVLDAGGALAVGAQLDLTRRRLSDLAAELLTALAAHPGSEVDTLASAALLGTDSATAHRALGELAAHHLVTGAAPGRYRRTELVRLYGAGLLAAKPAPYRRLLRERLADYYLAALQRCGFFLDPGQEDTEAPAHPPQAVPTAVDIRTALDWFQAEEPTIRALTDAAATTDPRRAWRLALTTGSLYYGASRFTDWLARARAGQQAAERCGDPVAVALLLNCRAQALVALERRHESAEAARRAVAAAESADGPAAVSARIRALATLALVTAMLGGSAEARRLAAAATALALESGNRRRLVDAKVHQGWVSLATGDREGAQRQSREARELLPPTPVTQVHLWSMLTEAQGLLPTVRDDAADLVWHRLLAACEEAGLLYLHALAEQSYAAHLLSRGREPEVRERLRIALDRFRAHDRRAGCPSEFTAGLEESLDLRAADRSPGDRSPADRSPGG